jgi:hypothetical protein
LQARLFASLGDADGDADGVLGASVAFSDPPRIAGLMVWDTAIVRTRFGRFVCARGRFVAGAAWRGAVWCNEARRGVVCGSAVGFS